MKNVLLQVVVIFAVAGAMWFGGEWYGARKTETKSLAQMSTTPVTSSPHPNALPLNRSAPPLLAPNEWPRFARARQAALNADPDLDTEYKQILKKLDAQQAKVDAAMIQADPNIKPVVAKLVVLRQKNSAPLTPNPGSGTVAKPVSAGPPVALTPDDMQQIRAARAEALQSNPDLIASAKSIADQMRDFESKLNAAMIKVDPSVSPIIAKFDGAHKSPGISATSSSVK